MQLKSFCFNLFRENTWLMWKNPSDAVVVDPGMYEIPEYEEFDSFCTRNGITPRHALITHCHMDHVAGAAHCAAKYGASIHMSPEDFCNRDYSPTMTKALGLRCPDLSFSTSDIHDGDVIAAGGFSFKVITTPGHSPGSCCFLEESEMIMFSGDTLFAGTIGRTDFMFSDYDSEIRSIMEKLILLDPGIRVLPGHGPETTIGEERNTNPMLEPFNEKEEPFDPDLEGIELHG